MKRRNFVQNCFWITTGVITGCSKSADASKKITYKLYTGNVTSEGKGLPKVLVSDGYDVIETNADGSFQLNVSSAAGHIFVCIPSGFAFPQEKKLAKHYIEISDEKTDNINFELETLKVNDESHQFVIWADPQIRYESDIKSLTTKSINDLLNYKATLPSDTLIHGITVGDIVHNNTALFSAYNTAVEKSGLTFYQVIGNHDMEYFKGSENYDQSFRKMYGPTHYSFNRGQVHYVILDDVFYVGGDTKYKGYIPDDQLEWLKKDLSFVDSNKLIVLCLHIPAVWIENKFSLYALLKSYKVHIMSGHQHSHQNVISDNIYEHIHGTVCGAWWTGPICTDGTPNGYAIYEVNGTELKWHYKSIGYRKDYQIRTNINKTNETTYLQANIWNWDPNWKVEWWADGVLQGELIKVDDYDYLSVELYGGPSLPKLNLSVEPRLCDHLFTAVIPPGTKSAKVVAKDTFDNIYESTTTF